MTIAMKKYLFIIGMLVVTFVQLPSSLQAQDARKEITREVSAQKGSLVRIVSSSPRLNIKSWDQPKVKITLLLIVDSAAALRSGDELFEDMGVSVKPFSNRVDILTGSVNIFVEKPKPIKIDGKPTKHKGPGESKVSLETVTVTRFETRKGEKSRNVDVIKSSLGKSYIQAMEVMIPAGAKLDINNHYGDVVIGANVDEAKISITNGALDAQDIKTLKLTAKYCNANLGNMDKAEVEFERGSFRAQNITDLDMDSKSATIEYEKGGYLYLRSQGDDYTINAIDRVEGRKLYGSIKIDQLNSSFDLEGNNADIKIRNISPEVSTIKINDKYADVRLPVKTLKNYYVDFTGYYSTVFAPFQKEIVKEPETNKEETPEEKERKILQLAEHGKAVAPAVGELAPHRFTGTVGDVKNKHTRIELICNSCTVDFK
jgi:hypothetical protein